jgi:transcriptional regulator with XRE-family HTH domain
MNRELGQTIKNLREAAGYSQGALARLIKASRPTVTQWENGSTKNIRGENLIALAKVFGITIDELLGSSHAKIGDTLSISHGARHVIQRLQQLEQSGSSSPVVLEAIERILDLAEQSGPKKQDAKSGNGYNKLMEQPTDDGNKQD